MIPATIEGYYRLHSRFYDATRWAFLFGRNKIKKYLPLLPADAKVLDLGCGTGKHLSILRDKYPEAEITGLDLSAEMLAFVEDASIVLRNEKYTLELFDDDSFDLILCSYSLSMMNEIAEKLQAIMHHLKPEGMLLVVDFDTTPFGWFSAWMKKNHVDMCSGLFKKLENSFDIEYTEINKAYFGLYTYKMYYGKNW